MIIMMIMLRVTQVALIRGSLYGLNYMSKQKNGNGGTIINIASIAGLRYSPYLPVYSASKFAVVAFSQALKVRAFFSPSFTSRENLRLYHLS